MVWWTMRYNTRKYISIQSVSSILTLQINTFRYGPLCSRVKFYQTLYHCSYRLGRNMDKFYIDHVGCIICAEDSLVKYHKVYVHVLSFFFCFLVSDFFTCVIEDINNSLLLSCLVCLYIMIHACYIFKILSKIILDYLDFLFCVWYHTPWWILYANIFILVPYWDSFK